MANCNEYVIKLLQLLFQKSGKYLENIGFTELNTESGILLEILELIKNYCVRVQVFNLKIFRI